MEDLVLARGGRLNADFVIRPMDYPADQSSWVRLFQSAGRGRKATATVESNCPQRD